MRPRCVVAWVALFVLCVATAPLCAQQPGQEDLDQAIEKKLVAKTYGELGEVIELCESALGKGLEEGDVAFAKQLLAATTFQRGSTVAQLILSGGAGQQWNRMRQVALEDFEKSLEADPNVAQAHILIARLHMLPGGERKRARTALDKAIELSEEDPTERATALILRSGLQTDAEHRLADLDGAVEAVPQDPQPLRLRGTLQMTLGKREDALADYESALALDPQHAPTHEARGLALFSLERFDDGRASFLRSAELQPDSPDPYLQLGRLEAMAGRSQNAIDDLTKALEIDDENAGALLMRAQIWLQQGDTKMALADADRAVELQPEAVVALRTRAALHVAVDDFDAAIEDLQRIQNLEPNDVDTLLQLGAIYHTQNRLASAIDVYDDVLAIDASNLVALRGRADANLSLGEQAKAVADYDAALELEPKSSGVLNNLAWVLATSPDAELRDGARSLRLATEACLVTGYTEAHILSTLAAAYAEMGDFEAAKRWSARAVEQGDETQLDNLTKELESYRAGQPWRELLDEPAEPEAANKSNTVNDPNVANASNGTESR